MGVKTGDELVLILEESSLCVLTPAEGVRRAQAIVSSYLGKDRRLSDELIWQSVFGPGSAVPPAGPNHSPEERARATGALRLLRQGKSARAWLLKGGD